MRFGRFLNKDIVAGIALILFSLWVIWEAREFAAAAARFRGVSPALFPTMLSVCIILLACVMILRGLRRGRYWEFTFDIRKKNSYLAIGLVVVTALYGLTLDFLGFLPATTLYTLIFIVWMKGAKPLQALIISCVAVGVIYFVFHTLMFVPFPQGEIFSLLMGE
jgi:putative tricarboxylic transport membrane protein